MTPDTEIHQKNTVFLCSRFLAFLLDGNLKAAKTADYNLTHLLHFRMAWSFSLSPRICQYLETLSSSDEKQNTQTGFFLGQFVDFGLRFVLRLVVIFLLSEQVSTTWPWGFHLPESDHLFKVETGKLVHNALWPHPPNHKLLKTYSGKFHWRIMRGSKATPWVTTIQAGLYYQKQC